MSWIVTTPYGRFLAEDEEGFYTTRQAKAVEFDTKEAAERARKKAVREWPQVEFKVVEPPL